MLRETVLAASLLFTTHVDEGPDRDLRVCTNVSDLNAPVARSVNRGFQNAKAFFEDHGIDVSLVNTTQEGVPGESTGEERDCVQVNVSPLVEKTESYVSREAPVDVEDYIPAHDQPYKAMATAYQANITEAQRDTKQAVKPYETDFNRRVELVDDIPEQISSDYYGNADNDTVTVYPYTTWAGAVDASTTTRDVSSADRSEYIDSYIGMTIAHEILHTKGLPHRFAWEYAKPSTNKTPNVMDYEPPARRTGPGGYRYSMTNRQEHLLKQALEKGTAYHKTVNDGDLTTIRSSLNALWERDYGDPHRIGWPTKQQHGLQYK